MPKPTIYDEMLNDITDAKNRLVQLQLNTAANADPPSMEQYFILYAAGNNTPVCHTQMSLTRNYINETFIFQTREEAQAQADKLHEKNKALEFQVITLQRID